MIDRSAGLEVANQPLWNANGPAPSIRRVIRLQDDADEADIRADILEWMTDSFPIGFHGDDRVRRLRALAAELRRTASLFLATASLEAEPEETARSA
jgi:hypothetical protein